MSNTTIGALTGSAGGTNVPLADCSTSATEIVVLGRDPSGSNATPYRAIPVSSLPVGQTEFQHILTSRADLVAVVAPVAGVFVLPAGSYFLKNSFALLANEGLQVNNVGVFIMGGGTGIALTGGSATIPLLQCTGAAGRVGLLTLTLNSAVADAKCLEAGGEVSTATSCVFTNTFSSATNGVVETAGTGRLTLNSCRITTVSRSLRHLNNQRITVATSRIESEQGLAVDISGANGWALFTGGIVRTTLGNFAPVFNLNAAGANLYITDCEVSSFGTQRLVDIGAAGCAALNIRGGEWQTGSAVAGTVGININGPITKEIEVVGVAVQNCAQWVVHQGGLVAAAKVLACTGTTNVDTCVNWNVANIPTRGLFEIGNQWNDTNANMFLNHQQNDARVMRRSNFATTALSETGIVP
jgi:hypothetical protein